MAARVRHVKWNCQKCGKQRWLKPYELTRKYCSRSCWYAAARVAEPVRPHPGRKLARYLRECPSCAQAFEAKTKIQRYCSYACVRTALRMRATKTREPRPCEVCGRTFRPQTNNAGRFCSRECSYRGQRGSGNANWLGGRHVNASGYVMVSRPGHSSAQGHGGYVAEHRLVMERVLGRSLQAHETVHHINGIKTDNRPENLQLRTGRHGKGVVHQCADCGSLNVRTVPIAESAVG